MTYRVEKGDTLSNSRRHDTTVEVVELNALGDANNLATGMVLYLDTTRGNARVAPTGLLRRHRRGCSFSKVCFKAHVKYPMRWPVPATSQQSLVRKRVRLTTGSTSVHPEAH